MVNRLDINPELVARAKLGDKQSFAQLYDLVAKDLYKVALYTLGSQPEAEDAVSETFLEAYKGLKNLRDDTKFKAWIMRILSIRCKRKITGLVAAKQQISLEDFVETADDVSPETADCSDRVTLRQALDGLAPDERAVVILSAVQGYTTREIGEIMGMPHGTVSSKLYRTLIKLRKKLEQ